MSTRRRRAVSAAHWGIPDRDAAGVPICRWCRGAVRAPRRTFCGDACVHEWKLRSDPGYVREQVWKHDAGVCRLCGFDLRRAQRRWARERPPASDRSARRRWRASRPRWEADHIVPVAEGGGECGLENYRLLCRACHVAVTRHWRRTKDAIAEAS